MDLGFRDLGFRFFLDSGLGFRAQGCKCCGFL